MIAADQARAWIRSGDPELIHKAHQALLEAQQEAALDGLAAPDATNEESHFYRGQLTAIRAVLEWSDRLLNSDNLD